MGIEPTAQAWEAWVLPLYDARYAFDSSRVARRSATLGGENRFVGDFHTARTPTRKWAAIAARLGFNEAPWTTRPGGGGCATMRSRAACCR